MTQKRKLRFGVFELDFAGAELRKSGVRIRLQEQPYRVLGLLLANPGEVVTREELRKALWPDETFVDFDQGLNSIVNKLRDALGDSASHPRYIETVPRRGYRFVASVEGIATEPPALPTPPPSGKRWRFAVVVALFTAALLAANHLYVRNPSASIRILALTSYPGNEVLPSLSPDGRHVAFAWNGEAESNYDVYVKTVGTEGALRLTTDPAMETNPVWSPDGSSIAFLRVRPPDTLEVWIAAPFGPSAVHKAGELRQPGLPDAVTRPGSADTHKRRRIAWHPKGEWLVVQDKANDAEPTALFLLSTRTGEKRRLTRPPSPSIEDRSPAVSPRGDRVAFTRSGQIYALSLDAALVASEPVRITSLDGDVGDPAWTEDGGSIVFSAGSRHNPGLWRVSAAGSEAAERILDSGQRALHPAVAGSRLVYSQWTQDVNIWKLEVPEDPNVPAAATRLIASTYLDHMPLFSPDGRRVAFISNRAGIQNVWTMNRDGSSLTRLTFSAEGEVSNFAWSPDSKRIAYQVNDGENGEIYEVGISGGPPRRMIQAKGVGSPGWSGDGRWLYFVARSGEQADIFRIPADAGGDPARRISLTTDGGGVPRESADSKWLYYAKENAVWRLPLPSGPGHRISPPVRYAANFAPVTGGLFFISDEGDSRQSTLEFLDFGTGRRRVVHRIGAPVMWGLAASPDGRTLLYSRDDHPGSDLKILENFR